MDGQIDSCHLQEVFSQVGLEDSIKLLPWCVSSTVPLHYMSEMMATAMQQDEDVPAASEPEGWPAPGPSCIQLIHLELHHFQYLPYQISPLGCPFAEFLAVSTQKKWDCPSGSSLDNHCNKRTHVDSQEVIARGEHSCAQGDEDTSELILGTRTSFKQQEQEPTSPLPVQPGPPHHPDDGTAAGSLRSTGDQSSSDLSREDVVDSDMGTVSGDCITYSLKDDMTIWTAQKKYWKRLPVCSAKAVYGTKTQLKRISKSNHAIWGHDQESVQAEWDCALVEDCNSFEMHRMTVRTDQLLHIAMATYCKIYTRDLEAKARGWAKTLVFHWNNTKLTITVSIKGND